MLVSNKKQINQKYNTWYSPVLIVRYAPIEKLALAARFEYYNDKNGVMIATGISNTMGFKPLVIH